MQLPHVWLHFLLENLTSLRWPCFVYMEWFIIKLFKVQGSELISPVGSERDWVSTLCPLMPTLHRSPQCQKERNHLNTIRSLHAVLLSFNSFLHLLLYSFATTSPAGWHLEKIWIWKFLFSFWENLLQSLAMWDFRNSVSGSVLILTLCNAEAISRSAENNNYYKRLITCHLSSDTPIWRIASFLFYITISWISLPSQSLVGHNRQFENVTFCFRKIKMAIVHFLLTFYRLNL